MSWEGKTRAKIESELMEALQHARAKYEDLSREHSRLVEESRDIGADNRDGNLILKRSTESHRALQLALEEYQEALKRFDRVVVGRELPEG